MKYRIKRKGDNIYIPQIKECYLHILCFNGWISLDEQLFEWLTEPSFCKFETYEEAFKIIQKYKYKFKNEKTIKYYKIK
jgi:hypothetical protein